MTSITLSLLFIHFLGRKEGEMKAFWDKSEPFLVFLITTFATVFFFNAARFLNLPLDSDEFLL